LFVFSPVPPTPPPPLCRIRDYAGLSPQLKVRASVMTGGVGIVRDQSVILG
jgi:hypothetical protein